MHPIANLALSAVVGFTVLVLYAVLPPQIYFTLLGAGGAALCLTHKPDENADKTNETGQNKENDK